MTARAQAAVCCTLMLVGVLLVYLPTTTYTTGEWRLRGIDYPTLHQRRMDYALEVWTRGQPFPPAWYSREQMGTPFRANVQNFPFLPTRIALLALVRYTALTSHDLFTLAALLAAMLAATCTFLFCRQLAMHPLAAAVAGWTFACSGFFASRLRAGQLTLLEGFFALPLLLWLIERCIANRPHRRFDASLILLGFATASIALAGHPQLPIYAVLAAVAYAIYRRPDRHGMRIVASMMAGGTIAAFALVPMMSLAARSSRTLPLARAGNDIAFPYSRLGTFFFPWKDGWPAAIQRGSGPTLTGNHAIFWDTVCYVGWTPLVAVIGLVAWTVWRRRSTGPSRFFALLAIVAFIGATPAWNDLVSHIPGTILRSPARLMYIVVFVLCIGLGAALHLLLRKRLLSVLAMIIIAAHAIDLTVHARYFVAAHVTPPALPDDVEARIREHIGDGRIGIDWPLLFPFNRAIDDAGFYDAISLATTYRRMLELCDTPPDTNLEDANAADMSIDALREFGVRLLLTRTARPDLARLNWPALPCAVYEVSAPRPRVEITGVSGTATYHRRSSDVIDVDVNTYVSGGTLLVREAFDPGWRATIDAGAEAPIRLARSMFIELTLPPGAHRVRLEYHTPGAGLGIAVSAAGLIALAVISRRRARRNAPASGIK